MVSMLSYSLLLMKSELLDALQLYSIPGIWIVSGLSVS